MKTLKFKARVGEHNRANIGVGKQGMPFFHDGFGLEGPVRSTCKGKTTFPEEE